MLNARPLVRYFGIVHNEPEQIPSLKNNCAPKIFVKKKQNIKAYKHISKPFIGRGGNVQLTMDYWIDIIITLLKIVFLIVVIYLLWTFYQNHTAGLTIEEE